MHLFHLKWFDLVQSQVGIRTEDNGVLVVARFGGGWKLQLHLGRQNCIQQLKLFAFRASIR